MLADSCEAAVRSISHPQLENIQNMVNRIFQRCFLDGQLNHSGLNLTDLQKLAYEFVRVLVGLHHHRIQYPSQKDATVGDALNKMVRKQSLELSGGSIDLEQMPALGPEMMDAHYVEQEINAAESSTGPYACQSLVSQLSFS